MASVTTARARSVAAEMLVDQAQLLELTAPEMTVLVGGLRALECQYGKPSTAFHHSGRRP